MRSLYCLYLLAACLAQAGARPQRHDHNGAAGARNRQQDNLPNRKERESTTVDAETAAAAQKETVTMFETMMLPTTVIRVETQIQAATDVSISTTTVTVTAVAPCTATSVVTALTASDATPPPSNPEATGAPPAAVPQALSDTSVAPVFTTVAPNFVPGFSSIPASEAIPLGVTVKPAATGGVSPPPAASPPSSPPSPPEVSPGSFFTSETQTASGTQTTSTTADISATSSSTITPSLTVPPIETTTAPPAAPALASSSSSSTSAPELKGAETIILTTGAIVPGFSSIPASEAVDPKTFDTATFQLSNSGYLGIGRRDGAAAPALVPAPTPI